MLYETRTTNFQKGIKRQNRLSRARHNFYYANAACDRVFVFFGKKTAVHIIRCLFFQPVLFDITHATNDPNLQRAHEINMRQQHSIKIRSREKK